jgi:hypothetical protein
MTRNLSQDRYLVGKKREEKEQKKERVREKRDKGEDIRTYPHSHQLHAPTMGCSKFMTRNLSHDKNLVGKKREEKEQKKEKRVRGRRGRYPNVPTFAPTTCPHYAKSLARQVFGGEEKRGQGTEEREESEGQKREISQHTKLHSATMGRSKFMTRNLSHERYLVGKTREEKEQKKEKKEKREKRVREKSEHTHIRTNYAVPLWAVQNS